LGCGGGTAQVLGASVAMEGLALHLECPLCLRSGAGEHGEVPLNFHQCRNGHAFCIECEATHCQDRL